MVKKCDKIQFYEFSYPYYLIICIIKMSRRCGNFVMWGTPEEELEVDPNVFCGKDVTEESKSPDLPKTRNYRYITGEDLKLLRSKLKERYEICGILIPGEGELELESRDIGPYIDDGERGSCLSTNVWINFHTHPLVTLPWPSTEDIFKVLESRRGSTLWGSLIFCEWGIWEIYSPRKVSKSYLDRIQGEWTEKTSDKLFYELNLSDPPVVPGVNEAEEAIKRFLDRWYRGWGETGLEITLTKWDDVPGHYPLQTGLQQVPS